MSLQGTSDERHKVYHVGAMVYIVGVTSIYANH